MCHIIDKSLAKIKVKKNMCYGLWAGINPIGISASLDSTSTQISQHIYKITSVIAKTTCHMTGLFLSIGAFLKENKKIGIVDFMIFSNTTI